MTFHAFNDVFPLTSILKKSLFYQQKIIDFGKHIVGKRTMQIMRLKASFPRNASAP